MMASKKRGVLYGLAALCFLLGALLLRVFTAVRFTGFLLCCAGGALVIAALLDRWNEGGGRAAKWCRRIFWLLLAAGFAFFAVLEAWVISWGRTDRDTPVDAVVVLGAGVNGREPSLSLLVRLEAALDYIQDKPEALIVVTGGQGRGEEISEARCMADWLTAHGVDEGRILLEEQAATTEENVRYTKAILADYGVDAGAAVAVVTSDYHLCRAAWLWGEGMVPVAARMPGSFWPLTVNYYIRDAFALAEAMVFP